MGYEIENVKIQKKMMMKDLKKCLILQPFSEQPQ